jgi:hypothetical protein
MKITPILLKSSDKPDIPVNLEEELKRLDQKLDQQFEVNTRLGVLLVAVDDIKQTQIQTRRMIVLSTWIIFTTLLFCSIVGKLF